MSNKIIATTTLATALLIGGFNTTGVFVESLYGGVLAQPVVLAANTSEKNILRAKGIQYRPGPSDSSVNSIYQINESKKSHRPVKSGNVHRTNEVSQPKRSRKLTNGDRFAYRDTPALVSPLNNTV